MKRELNLPNKIELFGQTIGIEYSLDQLFEGEEESDGLAYFNRNKIYIYKPKDRPQSTLDMIYLHELTHFMVYYASGDSKVTYHEPFIQATSVLIHQFLLTADYRNESILIPTKFTLGALDIKTKWSKQVLNHQGDESYAYTDLYSNRIDISIPDNEYCLERIEVAFCLQLLIYFSYIAHDDMCVKSKHAVMYNTWPYLLHQVLKQLIPTK